MTDKTDPRRPAAPAEEAHPALEPKRAAPPDGAGPEAAPGVSAAIADARARVMTKPTPSTVGGGGATLAAAAPSPGPAPAPASAPGAAVPARAGAAGPPAASASGAPVPAAAGGRGGGGKGGGGGAAPAVSEEAFSSRGAMALGILSVLILVGGFGIWAALANINAAVIASGKVEVETKQQVVEHPDGGVVGLINVRDGDRVAAGDVMLRLDDTLMLNELESLRSQYWELVARSERLEAEQLEQEELIFSDGLQAAEAASAAVADIVDGQRGLFLARARSLSDQVDQLRERQSQIREQVTGAEAQRDALERQLALVAQELEGQEELYKKGLAQLNRLLSLQREEARLQGQVGELTAGMAESRGRIAEIEIQIINLSSTRQEQAITELRDIQYQQNQVREQLASLEERMTRLDVRAPIDGVVTGMTVFALRSVVSPGEPILYIVPTDVELVIESQIDTIFIDQVYAGQPATLRFSAFNSRTTPELDGHVVKVSPDAFQDERTGRTYYTATLAPNPGELEKLDGLTLVPGMPVEGYIRSGERTPLSYLVKPLTDYFSKAMIEE